MENVCLSKIKTESVYRVFDTVARASRISRAEIAKETDLSLMTVGKIADAFLDRGIIVQAKETRSVAGRKAGLVSLNPDKFSLVLDVTSRAFRMMLISSTLEPIDKLDYEYNRDFYFEENLYIFLKNVKIYVLRNLNMNNCIGIGVLVPGAYDSETDTTDSIRLPELREIKLKSVIEDILKEKVDLICEDILSAAVSSSLAQVGDRDAVVFFLYIGDNICAAVVKNGKLLFTDSTCYFGQIITGGGKNLESVMNTLVISPEQFRELEIAVYNAAWLYSPDTIIIENHKHWTGGDLAERFTHDFENAFPPKQKKAPTVCLCDPEANHANLGIAVKLRSMWRDRVVDEQDS